jgi:hypothetical protein
MTDDRDGQLPDRVAQPEPPYLEWEEHGHIVREYGRAGVCRYPECECDASYPCSDRQHNDAP